MKRKKYSFERCPCNSKYCNDYHLIGIGKFVQGSGFNKEEVELIVNLLNEISQGGLNV